MPVSVPKFLHAPSEWPAAELGASILLLGTLQFATTAASHEALASAAQPNGWTYPAACCSNHDCRLVPASRISERPQGYLVQSTGEIIAYGDPKLRDSPDGEFHWCSVAGAENGRTICLFAPPKGF